MTAKTRTPLPASRSVNRATVSATGRGLSLVTMSAISGLLLGYGNDIGESDGGTGRNDPGTRRA